MSDILAALKWLKPHHIKLTNVKGLLQVRPMFPSTRDTHVVPRILSTVTDKFSTHTQGIFRAAFTSRVYGGLVPKHQSTIGWSKSQH